MADFGKPQGMTIDDIVKVIANQEHFTAFLLDLQHQYRISRALSEDPGDRLLNATRMIDEIIAAMPKLEEARKEYFERKRQEEEEEALRKAEAEKAAK